MPANIIRPAWRLISGKPAGFADGVDNVGVWGVKFTTITKTVSIPKGTRRFAHAHCPTGSVVTGGGVAQDWEDVRVTHSNPVSGTFWQAGGTNLDADFARNITSFAVCMTTKPVGALSKD